MKALKTRTGSELAEKPRGGAHPGGAADGAPQELQELSQSFATISQNLLTSYRELERRAEHVENDLRRANTELAEKVTELDTVTRDLEGILEALPTGVIVRNPRGSILRVNRSALDILGAREEELLGRREHPGATEADAGGEPRGYQRADGSRLVVVSRRSPIPSTSTGTGAPAGSVEILDDRTEVTELQERLHGLDKLAALGNMAGGIAHEIRNPLNAVQGFAALLGRQLEEGTRPRRWAELIVQGASEANAILTSMLTLANPEALDLESLDAEALLLAAIAAATPRTEEEQSPWHITSEASAPPFAGDRIKLRQALRNLIANAIDALPAGGRIHASIHLEGEEVVLRVDDSGPGISAAARRRLFEPFFTTRAEGTGLGLALVHSLAQLHGGRAEAGDSPAALGGASLRLRIPFVDPARPRLPQSPSETSSPPPEGESLR